MMDSLFYGKKLVVFGAGKNGKKLVETLLEAGTTPHFLFDNSDELAGRLYRNIQIIKPIFIEGATVIITAEAYYKELFDQLIEMGYERDAIRIKEQIYIDVLSEKINTESKNVIQDYPSVLQFPITYSCNFNCVMCGMSSMQDKKSILPSEIHDILRNPFFSRVKSVGVNGGEPFTRIDLIECFEAIINSLPKLQDIYLISNGYFSDKMDADLKEIRKMACKKGVRIHLTLSIDGIADMQDFHRGKKGSFEHICDTVDLLKRDVHYDSVDLLCTITKYNIFRINELSAWAYLNKLKIAYDIAGKNERISNQSFYDEISIFADVHAKMMAQEFFFEQYHRTGEERYFATYLYIMTGKRYGICPCRLLEWVTIFPNGQMGFCSTRSKELGDLLKIDATRVKTENMNELERIAANYCNTCPQNMGNLDLQGKVELFKYIASRKQIKIW